VSDQYAVVPYPLTRIFFTIVGGTFALYSLISRYAKVSLIPNQQAEDAMVSNYGLDIVSAPMRRAQWMKKRLENSEVAKVAIFLLTILGTSMVISDGVLTPAISGN
jgi:KUP system potassium uptake protein